MIEIGKRFLKNDTALQDKSNTMPTVFKLLCEPFVLLKSTPVPIANYS